MVFHAFRWDKVLFINGGVLYDELNNGSTTLRFEKAERDENPFEEWFNKNSLNHQSFMREIVFGFKQEMVSVSASNAQ